MKKLSLHGFTNWMSQQENAIEFTVEQKKKPTVEGELVGQTVFAKVSNKKLLERIEIQDGENERTMIQEFKHQGGEVIEYCGKNLLIKVESGTFLLPRFCVTE